MEGVGFHEVVITRDHSRSIAEFSLKEIELLINAYQIRYRQLIEEECVRYVSIFKNYGEEAGATIYHPHSQIIALPVMPSDVMNSLKGAQNYFKKNKACAHCTMTNWERKQKKRIVFENELAVAFCPFISRKAFEIRIFPKLHQPYFEQTDFEGMKKIAEALRVSLAKLFKGLKDPAYNFFIHTAPIESSEKWHYYHWHIEILPKTGIWAGFELGTGIEVSSIEPERAAQFLRNIKI